MIRKANPSDAMAIAAFLERHIETSMLLLGNLEAQGIDDTSHPQGTAFFLRETGDGITGVFGATNGGFLLCQIPGLTKTEAQTYAHLLRGYTLHGMSGHAEQTALIMDALPVQDWQLNRVEPLYSLDVAGLADPKLVIRAPQEADRALLTRWLRAYFDDVGMNAVSERDVDAHITAAITNNQMRVLIEDGTPVAMTAFIAKAGTSVKIGRVYTPPNLRGRGRAGSVIAAHLHEQRAQGITRAILSAASLQAAKSYERIGFQRVGDYRLAMLKRPSTLGATT